MLQLKPVRTLLAGCLWLVCSAVSAQAPLKVVTTTGMIADLVANIGGDAVAPIALMGSGVDPHLYKATQGDIGKLLDADVIFYNGLQLEGKMQAIFAKLANKKPVFAISEDIPKQQLLSSEDYQNQHDPHIWFDLELWQQAAQKVSQVLQQQLPQQRKTIEQRYLSYQRQLQQLDSWIEQQVALIPEAQRVLITAHDAFGYFARAYGMQVRALQGVNTASEFGLYDLKQLRELIIQRQIKAVFVESSVPRKFVQSLQQGLQASGYQVTIGGELFSDAMGPSHTPQGNYLGMVRHNVTTIVEALK